MNKIAYLLAFVGGVFLIMTFAELFQIYVVGGYFHVWVMGTSFWGSILQMFTYVFAGILITYYVTWVNSRFLSNDGGQDEKAEHGQPEHDGLD